VRLSSLPKVLLLAENGHWSEMPPVSLGEGWRCVSPGWSFANIQYHLLLAAMVLVTVCTRGGLEGLVHIIGLILPPRTWPYTRYVRNFF